MQENYIDDANQWMVILMASDFVVQRTFHHTKQKSLCQLVLGRDMILPMSHIENLRYIRQHKQR